MINKELKPELLNKNLQYHQEEHKEELNKPSKNVSKTQNSKLLL
jgi:hypothetical protein